MKRLLYTLIIIATLAVSFPAISNANRIGDVWVERLSSYVEVSARTGLNILIKGTSKYLNFGYVSGSSGYGFRDNAGTIEVKDNGGSWGSIASGGGGVGTVTSVAQTVPTGFTISGSPITSSGTLAISYDTGYEGLLTADKTNWNNFYTTPSSRITAGTGLSWTGNTINAEVQSSDLHSALTLGGTGTYLSLLGQVLTVDPITESDISDLTHYSTFNTDFDTRLSATTTLPNLTTLANLLITESQISDLTHTVDTTIPARLAGTHLTLVGNTLNVDNNLSSYNDDLTHTVDTNTTYLGGTNLTLSGTTFNVDDSFILNTGDTGTGVYNFGGASSFEIPNGTANTVNANGEIAYDTTDNQLILGASARVLRTSQKLFSFTLASSSLEFVSGGQIPVPLDKDGYTVTNIKCYVQGGTSVVMTLTDGTNAMDALTCGTTVTSDDGAIANSTVVADELMYVDVGTITGTPDYVTFSVFGTITRE